MRPLISVIVPVYQVEKYLYRCVESLLCQSYGNIEIILVDDGSKDMSGKICDMYGRKDARVRVLHKQNGGLSEARNAGLAMARGEYILFVDSDDWVSPYYAANLYSALSRENADLAISCFENVLEGKPVRTKALSALSGYRCLSAEECLKKMLYQDGVEICAWGKLYKRRIFEGLRYPVGKLYEDIPVTYRALKASPKVALIKNTDYYYFQRRDSIQNRRFYMQKLDGILHLEELQLLMSRDFPQLQKAARCRYFSMLCNILFQIKEKEYKACRKMLWWELLRYRKGILGDKEARPKARLAAVVSFGGYAWMNFVYRHTQWRG